MEESGLEDAVRRTNAPAELSAGADKSALKKPSCNSSRSGETSDVDWGDDVWLEGPVWEDGAGTTCVTRSSESEEEVLESIDESDLKSTRGKVPSSGGALRKGGDGSAFGTAES